MHCSQHTAFTHALKLIHIRVVKHTVFDVVSNYNLITYPQSNKREQVLESASLMLQLLFRSQRAVV